MGDNEIPFDKAVLFWPFSKNKQRRISHYHSIYPNSVLGIFLDYEILSSFPFPLGIILLKFPQVFISPQPGGFLG